MERNSRESSCATGQRPMLQVKPAPEVFRFQRLIKGGRVGRSRARYILDYFERSPGHSRSPHRFCARNAASRQRERCHAGRRHTAPSINPSGRKNAARDHFGRHCAQFMRGLHTFAPAGARGYPRATAALTWCRLDLSLDQSPSTCSSGAGVICCRGLPSWNEVYIVLSRSTSFSSATPNPTPSARQCQVPS